MPYYMDSIEHGFTYHIFNRGINGCDIFMENDNYEHFLRLYDKYIDPIADTYAWVLMKNHFHFLVRIKEDSEIEEIPIKLNQHSSEPLSGCKTAERVKSTPLAVANPNGGLKKYNPSNQFSHLFNSYAQAFNKRYQRTGSLFEHPFHRKRIENEKYLQQAILYIHNNPVHHNFVEHPVEYPWSSYLTCVSEKPTKLKRKEVIDCFKDIENFKFMHNSKMKMDEIEDMMY